MLQKLLETIQIIKAKVYRKSIQLKSFFTIKSIHSIIL